LISDSEKALNLSNENKIPDIINAQIASNTLTFHNIFFMTLTPFG